ncbi:hypothetical protein N5J40_05735 [Aeromonas caviae]|uniref:hypothetical protein n=1 Tax=Aeromonas caviae TaxID=648 RepID=UPI002446C9C5|nr:hypothetical protein [Aeromonas caviae]MDH1994328.1 hypothetical protein [Aeromonas caviae]
MSGWITFQSAKLARVDQFSVGVDSIEGFHYSKQINQLIATGWVAHQALRTVASQPTTSALAGLATSTMLSTSTRTVLAATAGSLLSTTAVPITLSLAATYGLYRAWRWLRD